MNPIAGWIVATPTGQPVRGHGQVFCVYPDQQRAHHVACGYTEARKRSPHCWPKGPYRATPIEVQLADRKAV